ncbi:MAG TPA: type I methionyl aminopeptidase [Bacteroidales bacterium]|jgi:methionyl aminopeptidase|nr:type I methionyl aminopeptidase [Bacteroidales bacterium]
MLVYKSEEEIEIVRRNNLLVSKTLAEVAKLIKPGVTTLELDKRAEEFIRDNGAVPGFLGYAGYPNSLCTSVNDQVVHGIPSDYVLKEGDIVSVDCGTYMEGYYGDTAYTFPVGEVKPEVMNLLRVTKESLFKGIANAIEGNRVGDIGNAVQEHAENAGYSVVREMVGHGLGKDMHEAPEVPNYGKRGKGILLKKGLVLCVEPMINMGSKHIKQDHDGWTIRTVDGKPSAHYELAIVVEKGRAEILSTFDYIEEITKNKI